MYIKIVSVLLLSVIVIDAKKLITPCPDVFYYTRNGGEDWSGWITIAQYPKDRDIVVKVVMSLPALLGNQKYVGSLDLVETSSQIYPTIDRNGAFHYTLNFPLKSPLPVVTSIKTNDYEICSGPPEPGTSTTITLSHTIKSYSFRHKQSPNLPPYRPTTYTSNKPVYYPPSLPTGTKVEPAVVTSGGKTPTSIKFFDNPCPAILDYTYMNYKWYGLVTVGGYPTDRDIVIQVKFSIAAELPSNFQGALDLVEAKTEIKSTVENRRNFHVRINFPIQLPLPSVTSISINGKNVCSGTPAKNTIQTITLQKRILYNDFKPSTLPQLENKFQPVSGSKDHFSEACGDTQVVSLIAKGAVTTRGAYPWLSVIYQQIETGTIKFICGGNLISKQHILTAAHCVPDEPDDYLVSLGKYYSRFEPQSKTLEVLRIQRHPDYSRNVQKIQDADIAIITMRGNVDYNTFIRPICMFESSADDMTNKVGIIAGWGAIENGRPVSQVLRHTSVKVVSEDTCKKSNKKFEGITDRILCAAGDGKSGACRGDSGGGLFVSKNGRMYLQGIISSSIGFDFNDCNNDFYSVFINVNKFVDWIKSTVQL